MNERNKKFPEERIFSLNDLAKLYEHSAVHEPRIKEFIEKLVESLKTQETEFLHNF